MINALNPIESPTREESIVDQRPALAAPRATWISKVDGQLVLCWNTEPTASSPEPEMRCVPIVIAVSGFASAGG